MSTHKIRVVDEDERQDPFLGQRGYDAHGQNELLRQEVIRSICLSPGPAWDQIETPSDRSNARN